MIQQRECKTHYSQADAVRALGITVEQFHSLIRNHIIEREEDLQNVPKASFQASDLLVLQLLSNSQAAAVRGR